MNKINKAMVMVLALACAMVSHADSFNGINAYNPYFLPTEINGVVMPDFAGDINNFYHLFKPRSGWWWNPNESGTGLNLDIQQGNIDSEGGGLVFVSYYVYDDAGQPVWYTWAGYWRKSDWQTWHDTGVIGRVESLGNVSRTVGGRPIGGPQQAPAYEDAGLGKAVLEFTDPMNLRLTLGGETREMEWMEWKDDLQSSARCTQGTPENPAQCRYSIMEGDWWAKGQQFAKMKYSNEPAKYSQLILDHFLNVMDTAPYSVIKDADVNKVPSLPFVASETVLFGIEKREDTAYFAVARDAVTGEEWLFRYGGYPGYNRNLGYNMDFYEEFTGDNLPYSVAAMKIVYIDENTAVAVAYDEQDCVLGYDDCGDPGLSKEELAKYVLVFRRGVPKFNDNLPEDDIDEAQWPSFW